MPPQRFFTPLISTYKLIINAHSTRWPSYSSFAVSLLCICLLFSAVQFGVILALGIKLLRLDDTPSCYSIVAPKGWVLREMQHPVTFIKMDGTERFSIGRNTGKFAIIYASMVMPVVIITLLLTLGWMHFRKAGISNRAGVCWGFVALVLLFIGTLQDSWLGPDLHKSVKGTLCWQTGKTFAALKAERNVRFGLELGSEVLSGVGALCTALYIALAVGACNQNRKDSATSTTRLQDLSTPATPNNTPESEPAGPIERVLDPFRTTPATLQAMYPGTLASGEVQREVEGPKPSNVSGEGATEPVKVCDGADKKDEDEDEDDDDENKRKDSKN